MWHFVMVTHSEVCNLLRDGDITSNLEIGHLFIYLLQPYLYRAAQSVKITAITGAL